jgi:hypothetical protein
MKTAITVIAICEVIRTIQITVDLVFGFFAKKKMLESIIKVGDSVTDDFKPDRVARAIIDEAAREAKNERK